MTSRRFLAGLLVMALLAGFTACKVEPEAPAEDKPQETVVYVTLTPSSVDRLKGETQQFAANMFGTPQSASAFDWAIVESRNPGTTINASGLLTIAAAETVSALTVKATLISDTSKSGTATVKVHQTAATMPTVTGVTVNPSTAEFIRGSVHTQQFNATVNGTNSPSQSVDWEVTGGGTGTSITTGGLLTIAAAETAATLTMKATSTADTAKSGTATVTLRTPTVTSVTITPPSATVVRGQSRQFNASVTGNYNPAATVTWSVTGNTKAGTAINTSGLLTVAADETASSLTVKAASTVTPSVSKTATVTLTNGPPVVTSVTVTPATAEFIRGSVHTQQFNATVNGTNSPDPGVTWTVSGKTNAGTSINSSGLLTIAAAETATALTVKAQSWQDATKSGTATVTLSIPPTVNNVTVTPLSATAVKGGASAQFTANVSVLGGAAQTVNWTITTSGTHSGTTINASGVLTVDKNEQNNTLAVKATSTFDSSKSGTATVTLSPYAGAKKLAVIGWPKAGMEGDSGAPDYVVIVPAGTPVKGTGATHVRIVASDSKMTLAGGTLTINLRGFNPDTLSETGDFTGSGNFDVYIIPLGIYEGGAGDANKWYKSSSPVTISAETTPIPASITFTESHTDGEMNYWP